MLLFNIFSLQFTAVFPLFHKSAGTRSIKFLLAPVEISGQNAVEHLHHFLNLLSPSNLLCGPNKRKLLGAKSGLYGKCCSSF